MTDSNVSRAAGVAESDAGRREGILDKVRSTATDQLTTQKNRATDGLGSVAQAVRQSTHQLREGQHDTIAGYVEQAADQIERFSRHLRDKNVTDLFGDVQRLARRQPAVFVGGAFALGLLSARFFKSSPPSTSAGQWRPNTPATGYGSAGSPGIRRYAGTPRSGGQFQSQVHDYRSAPPLMDETGAGAAGGTVPDLNTSEAPESGDIERTRGRGNRTRRGTQSERS